jgi:REP element-mobilizing transposase RayT
MPGVTLVIPMGLHQQPTDLPSKGMKPALGCIFTDHDGHWDEHPAQATRLTETEIEKSITNLENHEEDSPDGSEQKERATRLMVNRAMESRANVGSQLKDSDDGSPLRKIARPKGPTSGSLGAIIGQFKSRATKRIWALPGMKRYPVWQRNYYDHIIRDEQEYQLISQYIETNPIIWDEDEYSSNNSGEK